MWIRRPAMLKSRQGLLLVEAVLSAVVIAVGLVLISRGLSSQLRALHSLEEYDILLPLAQGKLLEFESKLLANRPLQTEEQSGTFSEPFEQYQWSIASPGEVLDTQGDVIAKRLVLSVERRDQKSAVVSLTALWPPEEWVPDTWN